MTDKPDTTRDPREGADPRNPITGAPAPGVHPIGTSTGAAAGALAGAAAGIGLGLPGAGVGALIGGLVGGLTGQKVAAAIDPAGEETYWRENYESRSYFERGRSFTDYRLAYKIGFEGVARYEGMTFEEAENDLRAEYGPEAELRLPWATARLAAKDAWTRVVEREPVPQKREPWEG